MNKRLCKKIKKKNLIKFEETMINSASLSQNEFVFNGKTYSLCKQENLVQTLIDDRFLFRINENVKQNKIVNNTLYQYFNI